MLGFHFLKTFGGARPSLPINLKAATTINGRSGKYSRQDKNNEKSGQADDHWNRYHEDFERLSWLNANTHRFSVEWSRLEPTPGVWDACSGSALSRDDS